MRSGIRNDKKQAASFPCLDILETTLGIRVPEGRYLTSFLEDVDLNLFREYRPLPKTISFLYLNDCFLDGGCRCVSDAVGVVYPTQYLMQETDLLSALDLPILSDFQDTKVGVGANGLSNNYFHWMTQCLPAIYLLCKYGPGIKGIALCNLKSWQRESIKALSILDIQMIEMDAGSKYFFRKAIYIDVLCGSASFARSVRMQEFYSFLRNCLIGKEILGTRPFRKIFISRNDAPHRRLLNEESVYQTLIERGFEIVTIGKMSLWTQASLFCQASFVVAPHGAGLTNIIFCQPGTIVYELLSSNYVNSCFCNLALQNSLFYWADFFDQLANEADGNVADWFISPTFFRGRLAYLLDLYEDEIRNVGRMHLAIARDKFNQGVQIGAVFTPEDDHLVLFAVKSVWDTHLFFDQNSSTLRHGVKSSESNKTLLISDRPCRFLIEELDGILHWLSIPVDPSQYLVTSNSSSLFLYNRGDGIAHISQGSLYLCAEEDGSCHFSRTKPGLWETFHLEQIRRSTLTGC